MTYIYKITNDINNKIYIGQTEAPLKKRLQQHYKDSLKERNKKRPLYIAIQKYGIEHFRIELIEETSKPDEREKYWINYYNSFLQGYNATLGGDGKALYNSNEILEEILKETSVKEILKKFGCCKDIVRKIAHDNNIDLNINYYKDFLKNHKKVFAYTKDNKFIRSFESTVEASKWCYENKKCKVLNAGVRSHISEVARGKRKSAYGYIWKYDE